MKSRVLVCALLLWVNACSTTTEQQKSNQPTAAEQLVQSKQLIEQADYAQAKSKLNALQKECAPALVAEGSVVYIAKTEDEKDAYLMRSNETHQEIVVLRSVCDEVMIQQALLAQQQGDTALVEQYLHKSLEVAPFRAQYWLKMGEFYLEQKQWKEAKDAFNLAEHFAPLAAEGSRKFTIVEAKHGLGSVLIKTGHWDSAEKVYEDCLLLNPQDEIASGQLQYIGQIRNSF